MSSIQINFHQLPLTPTTKPAKIFVNVGSTIENIISVYNLTFNAQITNLYNLYGQSLPTSYQVQKTDLDVYVFHKN